MGHHTYISLSQIVTAIKGRGDWLQILQDYRNTDRMPKANGKAHQELAKTIQTESARGRSGTAIAAARVGTFLDSKAFLRNARHIGSFRASRLNFQSNPLSKVVHSLLTDAEPLKISISDREYLQSVKNLLALSIEASNLRTSLLRKLRLHRNTILKSCLVYVDRKFRPSVYDQQMEEEALTEHLSHPKHVSREEYAEALSLLTAMLHAVVGLSQSMTISIDEALIRNGYCEHVLRNANKLIKLREAELLLDCFPYRAITTTDGVLIEAIEDTFEPSVSLGYIQMEQQLRIRHQNAEDATEKVFGLSDLARDLYRQVGSQLISRKRKPIDRYVLEVPLAPPFLNLIKNSNWYREEYMYLLGMANDAFNTIEWVENATVVEDITVRDLMMVQRLFSLLAKVFFQALDRLDDNGNALDMRSRIPVYKESKLLGTLTIIFNDKTKAKQILKLLSYDPNQNRYFDLQYTPLLKLGSYYLLPMGVFSSSDLVRGVMYNANTRLLPVDGSDPMQDALETALRRRGFLVATNIKRKSNGTELEIDILAMANGHLFIFECKNAFHPCNMHELRGSYDHVVKAGKQLSRSASLFSDPIEQRQIFRQLGWPTHTADSIGTCIATANRLFNGHLIDGHPVRQAHEILNFLNEGKLRTTERDYRLWLSPTFCPTDLRDYLGNAGYVADIFVCMEPTIYSHNFGKKINLQVRSFGLNQLKLQTLLQNQYSPFETIQETTPMEND